MRADFSSIAAIGRDYERQLKYVSQLFDAISQVAESGEIPTLKFVEREETFVRIKFCGRRYVIKHEFQRAANRDTSSSAITRFLQDDIDDTSLVEKQKLTIDWRGNAQIPRSTHHFDVSDSDERSYIVFGLLEDA